MNSKSKTKPIYSQQVEGAANTATNVYNQNAGSIQAGADRFASTIPSILDRYRADPQIGAARSHYGDVLSGKYLNGNPYIDSIVGQTGDSIRNQVTASLGTRGQTGGSAHSGIVARELAKAENDLRYNDYNTQANRMDNAAASVGNLVGAEGDLLNQAIAAYQAQTAPLMAANDQAATVGGLLGPYTKTKQKGSVGGLIAGAAGSALSGWAAGGFKGV